MKTVIVGFYDYFYGSGVRGARLLQSVGLNSAGMAEVGAAGDGNKPCNHVLTLLLVQETQHRSTKIQDVPLSLPGSVHTVREH